MEALHYVRAIIRSWWIVIIAVVVGLAGGFYVYATTTPVYQVGVRLVVALKTNNVDPISAQAISGARAATLAQVAGTVPAIRDAATAAGFPNTQPAVAAVGGDQKPFVNITVTSASPQLAAAIANAFVKTLPASTVRLTGADSKTYQLKQLARVGAPTEPVRPVLTQNLGFGLVGGLVIGIALALLREILNHSLRSTDDLRRSTGLVVLGTVPHSTPKILLPAMTEPRSARAEAYRQVRTTLVTARRDDRPVRLAVTSSVMGEGKTSVATNVAAVFSRSGHRVVIVDADLRRPRVGAFFGVEPAIGLSDILAGRAEVDQALLMLDDAPLGVITSGPIPPDPSELLGSEAFDKLMEELGRRFEFVIVDTPPVLPVTDALAISPKVDGIILVVRLGYTSRLRVRHAMAALDRVDANVWGVVPNGAGRGTDSDYSYPYHYKYYGRDKKAGRSDAVPARRPGRRRGESAPAKDERPAGLGRGAASSEPLADTGRP